MGHVARSLVFITGLLVASTGVASADDSSDLTTSPGSVALLGDANPDEVRDVGANWLLGVQAGVAQTTSRIPSVNGSERFRLILGDVTPVTMFSERPIREARLISPKALVSHWSTWFAEDPPNALITVPHSDKAPMSLVVTLDRPTWNEATRSLVFEATRERAKHDPQVSGPNWKRPEIPRQASGVSVFIDGAFWRPRDPERPQKGAPPPPDKGIRPPLTLPTLEPTPTPTPN